MFGKVTPQSTPSPEQDDLLQSLLRADTLRPKAACRKRLRNHPRRLCPQPPTASGWEASRRCFRRSNRLSQQPVQAEYQPVHEEPQPPAPFTAPVPAAPPKPPADLTSVFSPVSINKPSGCFASSSISCGTQARRVYPALTDAEQSAYQNTTGSASGGRTTTNVLPNQAALRRSSITASRRPQRPKPDSPRCSSTGAVSFYSNYCGGIPAGVSANLRSDSQPAFISGRIHADVPDIVSNQGGRNSAAAPPYSQLQLHRPHLLNRQR